MLILEVGRVEAETQKNLAVKMQQDMDMKQNAENFRQGKTGQMVNTPRHSQTKSPKNKQQDIQFTSEDLMGIQNRLEEINSVLDDLNVESQIWNTKIDKLASRFANYK